MDKDTLALEQTLLQFLEDDRLSDGESREFKIELQALPTTSLNFLRNRLFELARDRLGQNLKDPMVIIRWLDRCTKALVSELNQRQTEQHAYFTPGNQCLEQITGLLRNADTYIDICVFTISDNRLSNAILEAHAQQVQVRIISDNHKQFDAGSDIEWLTQQGIPIRFDRTPDHMHHKFCIVDGLSLINGSFNWTRSASERNQENIVISRDAALIDQFQQQFDALWEEFA